VTQTILPIIALSAVVLLIAYFTYGRLVARWLGTDASRTTPAIEFEDGNDFVPAPAPVVLGGHFTAIAAAGPVVGPILAGLAFGWLPALLWIVLGAIFIGGVHDAGALLASIRHKASSITQVVREHMSRTAYLTFLMFVWISLVYVIIAFASVTAESFSKFQLFPGVLPEGQGLNGGAVAVGATAYLVMSIIMGLVVRHTKVPWWAMLIVSALVLGLTIWKAPALANWLAAHGLPFMNTASPVSDLTRKWSMGLLIYCFIASIAPMWILLQPRGVIGATFLYAALLFGIVGTFVGGWSSTGRLSVQYSAFTGFSTQIGYLFPFLFITIACGACSGFHSIVASGTTSKQVRTERHVRPIGYGAMLLESMVAVFALACVMILPTAPKGATPDGIYARGIGTFMNIGFGIPLYFAISFGLLAFSSFVFDTLDVCTRLGRYVLQEMLGLTGIVGGAIATFMTLIAPAAYLWYAPPEWGWRTFWIIFGTSNQLLAALTLVGVSVWLWRTGRPVWFALLPAAFMLISTGTALILNFSKFRLDWIASKAAGRGTPNVVNMLVAGVLFGLGALVVFEAVRVWRLSRRLATPVPAAA
jgi:carbon starvation protein